MPSSPSATPRSPGWLTATPYAHRGLHGAGKRENSRAAFEAAIAAGFGTELDVQRSRDGHAMVFHDDALDRLTDAVGRLDKWDAASLQAIRLRGTEETIPTLAEITTLIGGRAPLLVEIKADRRPVGALCRAVRAALSGDAAVMSFNPEVGRWFARHAPEVVRGLVVTEDGKRGWRGRIERRLALWRARPDFLAYDIRDLPSPFAAAARKRGLTILTWTVRNARDAEVAAVYADQIIHELPSRR
ncbi:MAG: glycerophosphodiester phosphodiesterase [Pseudomonadota bacterium]|nr:glycerophosphodiester phosphodiesterase [Pseudomonadota bacterium]